MITETAIKTGMRRAELANLLVRHINFGSGSLTVVAGKGSRARPGVYSQEYRDNFDKIFSKDKK